MFDALTVKVGVLLLVTLVYAAFDVFNKRNIPNVIVYATILVGIAVAILYNYSAIWIDFGISIIIALCGYLIYRAGFLGGGDVLELVFITLVFPLQFSPYYADISQIGIPFIISVIISAGYTALVFIPLYYLIVKRIFAGKKLNHPAPRSVALGTALLVAYIAFAIVFYFISRLSLISIFIILVLAITSFITLMFEKDIYEGMISWIAPAKLENGDMIAVNLMSRPDVSYFKNKYNKFGRLVTEDALKKLKPIKKTLPVYRDSVPFSLFIFLGVLISLTVGNLVLIIIGFTRQRFALKEAQQLT